MYFRISYWAQDSNLYAGRPTHFLRCFYTTRNHKVCLLGQSLQAFITGMKMSNFLQRMPQSQGCRRESFLVTQGSCEPTSPQFLRISPSVCPSPRLNCSFGPCPFVKLRERREDWWFSQRDVGLALSEMEHHTFTAGGSKSSAAFPTGLFFSVLRSKLFEENSSTFSCT